MEIFFNLTSLHHITQFLSKNNIDAEAITAICLGLSRMIELKTLKFDVGSNIIRDAGSTCVLAYFGKLIELQNLSVDFR